MRPWFIIPASILAGLAVWAFVRTDARPAPASIIVGTPVVRDQQEYALPVIEPAYAPVRDTRILEPHVDANAALLYHVESGRTLLSKNATTRVPIASLTKLLSALVAQQLFLPDEIVTVSSHSVRVDGQKQTLYADERMFVRDLMAMMLVESSNDAAYALAEYASAQDIDFVGHMNQLSWTLGMRGCLFTDPAGLDDEAYCTADDLVRLVRYALQQAPQLWPVMASPEVTIHSADGKLSHDVLSTNELLGKIGGVVGGKTGYTDGALGCLAMVVKFGDKGDTLISIVLGSRSRFADTQAMIQWAQDAYRWD
jgi:D-alanyl-D-alanine carboxypeptidase